MLNAEPKEVVGWIQRGSTDNRCVSVVDNSDNSVRIAFQSRDDRFVYVLVIDGGNEWLDGFAAAAGDLVELIRTSGEEFAEAYGAFLAT